MCAVLEDKWASLLGSYLHWLNVAKKKFSVRKVHSRDVDVFTGLESLVTQTAASDDLEHWRLATGYAAVNTQPITATVAHTYSTGNKCYLIFWQFNIILCCQYYLIFRRFNTVLCCPYYLIFWLFSIILCCQLFDILMVQYYFMSVIWYSDYLILFYAVGVIWCSEYSLLFYVVIVVAIGSVALGLPE